MTINKKIGIVIDKDFAIKHNPPYPHPTFLSYESPIRIKSILTYLEKNKIFEDERIIKLKPKSIDDSVLNLAHSKYYINSIKHLSYIGNGLLNEEVFVTKDSYDLAKKAVGGTIQAIEEVINQNISQSIALIRPPGHHALREIGSGLCIFNNIANSIIYLRERLNFKKKIVIIDIDDHYGDGIVQYFYEDPSVLYISIHEYDYLEGDIGFINELGDGEGIGTNINFPLPMNSTDDDFLEFIEILEPIINQFTPELIIVAAGFDMHYNDPIGNNLLTSVSYFNFTKKVLKIAEKINGGKLVFSLEGGYSLVALPYCIHAIIQALLKEKYEQPDFEKISFLKKNKSEDLQKMKTALLEVLSNFWEI